MIGRLTTVTALGSALLWSPAAHGDPASKTGDASRAESLFRSGKQIRDAGMYQDACPLFEESSRLDPGIGVLLYLGDCEERLGRTASAWVAFRRADELALSRDDRRAEIAHARSEALAPRLSGLTLVVPALRGKPEVSLDGSRLPPDSWNVPLAVDPGDHVVTVATGDGPPKQLVAHVNAGDRLARLAIPEGWLVESGPAVAAPAKPAAAAEAAPAAMSSPPPGAETNLRRRWLGIGLLAAGAGGVATGVTLLLNRDKSQPGCSCSGSDDPGATIGAVVGFALGGAALIGGLALTVATPDKPRVGWSASPVFLAGGGGAQLRADF